MLKYKEYVQSVIPRSDPMEEMPIMRAHGFIFSLWLGVASCLGLMPSFGLAQVDTGAITGTVMDASGAALPGAKITAVNEATQIRTLAITNEQGHYVITPLRVGPYTLSAELMGFKKEIHSGVVLQIQERLQVNFRLQVGEIAEEVLVTSQTPLLETETSNLGQVISDHTVENLPLNGRNFIQLALLSAGASPSYLTRQRDNFVANGNRPVQNSYVLDGMDNKAYILGFLRSSALTHKPSVDAIQEFKVQTSTFSAEYGQGAGAVVNATIKSGTNEFYGTLFEFHRNSALDATPYFQPVGTAKPAFLENQFGGTAGGPIKGNRAFFFVSYEGARIVTAAPRLGTVPTGAWREGNFGSAPIFDPATTRCNPSGSGFLRDPFPNNIVPRERWDPVAAKLIELFPRANRPGNALNYFYNPKQRVRSDQIDGRVDYKLSETDSLFGRFSLANDVNTLPALLPPPANDIATAFVHGRSFVLGYTRTFSPRVVNEWRGGFNRTLVIEDIDAPRRFAEFGIIGAWETPEIKGLPTFNISGFNILGTGGLTDQPIPVTGSGVANVPVTTAGQTEIVAESLSLVRGNHNIKIGAEVRWNIANDAPTADARPSFNFNGVYTQDPQRRSGTGHALADFLLGLTSNATVGTQSRSGLRNREYLFFWQDDWKVTPKLTLNLGVRYELVLPFWEVKDRQANFVIDRARPDFGQLVIAGTRGGSVRARTFTKIDYNNIAPRVGFAYQLAPRTVLRGGFGIFYGRDEGFASARRPTGNPPFYVSISFPTDQITPNIVLRNGFPLGILDPANMVNPTVNAYPEDFPFPYVQQWSLNLERELPGALLLQTGYVGSSAVKLWMFENINIPEPGPGPIQPRRPIQGVGNIYPSIIPSFRPTITRALSRWRNASRRASAFSAATP